MREKGRGWGGWGGWGDGAGTGKGTGKSMRMRLSKLPSSKLPFSFSPIERPSPTLTLSHLHSSTNFHEIMATTFTPNHADCRRFRFPFCYYSQGQKHVIQLKKSQELISPNMSSELQLGNSPELIFISTGRCQLDDFRGSPPGFCCGVSLNFWRWDLNYTNLSN